MDIMSILKEIGLDNKEIEIYLSLLKGIQSITQISQETKIPRSAIYPILERLEKKSFIIQQREDNKIKLIPKSPQEIIKQLKHKYEQFELISKDLENLSKQNNENIQTIICQNSKEIEKQLLNIYLNTKNSLYSYGDYEICRNLFQYHALKLRKIRKENNITLHVKAYSKDSPQLYKTHKKESVNFEFKEQFKNSNTYIIFNSTHVCIHTLQNNILKCVIIKDLEYSSFNKNLWENL